jgi:hypothetical protein
MTQVVEPEADVFAFLEPARLHRRRTEMIFDQHVGDAGRSSNVDHKAGLRSGSRHALRSGRETK